MIKPENGVVYLVGAGPGSPDLLTVRAKELLESADVVAYDALISPSVLSIIPAKSELIPIGYRGYGSKQLGYGLHPTVIEMAKQGKTVVRLKSGDPFIFGRGYQECMDLTEEGIRFEVVPGVSSSLGAAVYAGFPLTHRDYSSDVVFASGHDLRGGSESNSKWEALAQTGGTIVIYMGATKIQENCERLIQNGRPQTTPAIYIAAATCGNQKIIQGTLQTLGVLTKDVDKKLQALIVIGEVIKSREIFDWRQYLPLRDKRLLVVRARPQQSKLTKMLKELGAEVIEAPQLDTTNIYGSLLASHLRDHKHLLFSDSQSVKSFFSFFKKNQLDVRELSDHFFYTMDKGARDTLSEYGILGTFFNGYCKMALDKAKTDLPSDFLIFGSDLGRESLQEDLLERNVTSTYYPLFKLNIQFPHFPPPEFDGIIFASSSSVKLLAESEWENALAKPPLFTIGEKSYSAAKKIKENVYQSTEDTRDSLIELLVNHWRI